MLFKDLKPSLQQDEAKQQPPLVLTKNEEILKHKIPLILKSYESLKEWSDLSQWQIKLQMVLQEHPCGYLPKKKLLFKRLAQCLSPVWNKAIHENALAIYDIVLNNLLTIKCTKYPDYSFVQDLPLISLGLYPFFGFSSIQCKPKVLELLTKYYYPLKHQLIPTLGGLISSIIVGMEDTNEEQVKKVMASLDMACDAVGVKPFYGTLWICILRSSRTRIGGFKYLMRRWNRQKQKDVEEDQVIQRPASEILISNTEEIVAEQQQQQQFHSAFPLASNRTASIKPPELVSSLYKIINDQDKMPNKSALVLNALLASLEDESSLVKRAALDFLFAHSKINEDVFSYNEKLILIQASMLLFCKLDHAVVRRINNWFFGEMDLNETEQLKQMEIIQLIHQALNRILVEDQYYSVQSSEDRVNDDNLQLFSPLKIIQNWYMQHPETVELTLEQIGYQLVKYMHQNAVNNNIQKASERLLESIASNCELILMSLYKMLRQKITDKKVDQVIELVKLVNYSLDVLMINQFGSTAVIKDESEIETYRIRTKSLQNLVELILVQVVQLTPEQFYSLPLTEVVLDLALQTLNKVQYRVEHQMRWNSVKDKILIQSTEELKQEEDIPSSLESQQSIEEQLQAIHNFSSQYVSLNKYAVQQAQQLEERGDLIIFPILGQILLKLQVYIMKYYDINYVHLPEWAHCLLNSVQSASPRISISSTDIILEIVKHAESHQNSQNLAKLITTNSYKQIRTLGALNSFIRLSSIKNESNIEDLSPLAKEHNYMKDVFMRLWELLDYHYQDSKVIDSILYFSKQFPNIFTFVIESAFINSGDDAGLEVAIRRYQIFCRLTNPHFRKFSHENKGVGVLLMLSYLEHENPLMRHASKTWLTETAPFYFRILDPLLERLIDAQIEANPIFNGKQLVYKGDYPSDVVKDTVKKLNLLLTNNKEWYIPYIQNAKISNIIQQKLKEYAFNNDVNNQDITPSYMDLILHLFSQLIQGCSSENHPAQFVQDNQRVNALCAEYFEALLINITTKKLKGNIIIQYMDIFLKLLKNLIISKDIIMQIQVLNLLKSFILSSKEVETAIAEVQRLELITVLSSNLFIPNMLEGLKTSSVFYLKSRYLNTLILSIYTISDLLPQNVLTDRVGLILNQLLSLLSNNQYNQSEYNKKPSNARSSSLSDDKQKFVDEQFLQSHRMSNIDYANSQYFKEEQKNQWKQQEFEAPSISKLELSTVEQIERRNISIGENFEEVMCLSNSVKALVGFYFRFKDEVKDDPNEQQKPNLQGILVDILTFNMLKLREKQQVVKVTQQPQFAQFQETSQMILKNLPLIISSYLYCWRLGVSLEQWQFFTTKGVIVYEYSKFDKFNNAMKEQLHKLNEDYTDDDQIKQSILSVMSPCAFQFTSELISACLSIWSNGYTHDFYEKPKQNLTLYKLMELLLMLHLQPEEFLNALMKTSQMVLLSQYYAKRIPFKKNFHLINNELATQENDIFFFLYVYLSANLHHSMKQPQLIKFWMGILQFTKTFLTTKHINTQIWILELFYMISWKYSPKEILNHKDLRKELHSQSKIVFESLSELCTESSKFVTVALDQRQSVIVQGQSSSEFKIMTPFTPVVYQIYQEYLDVLSHNGEKTEELRDLYYIQRTIFDPYRQKSISLSSEEFGRRCALICFKTLKKIAYVTLINTYEANKNDRIIENTKHLMDPIFPLLDNKQVSNQIIVEAGSEILHSFLKNSRDQLPKELRKFILNTFNGSEFFKCSRRTLKYWKEIIDWTSEKGDLLMEQLGGNSNLFTGLAGLFSSKSTETIKKIKGFERVCFIIYSGPVDKYISKINILLDSILDTIKEVQSQHPAIIVLIIFCIRILILRLSPQSLNEIFRRIWPSLVSMLIQIFVKKREKLLNPNVLLAGLKLLELLSLFQLEEFYFYQWIFVFDYFGIIIDMKNLTDQTDETETGQNVNIQSPFEFIPYVSHQFPNISKFNVDYQNQLYPDQMQSNFSKKNRLIIIKDAQVESELEVRRQAVYLCQYLLDINQQRVEISSQQLEVLIEAEFISLDEYIFTIG